MITPMDDVRIGAILRIIRIRRHLRQSDVARRARVSRQIVGRIEGGEMGRYPLGTVRAVAGALGVRLDVQARWQGAEVDRVLHSAHAELHESVAVVLGEIGGWVWRSEVTFSHFGERGVIDILAWHAETRSLLIIELKTELVDPQELVATMHRRVRLGRTIASEQGWDPATVSAWVVVRDTTTERRRLKRHGGLLRAAFPAEGRTMRAWLRQPRRAVSALSFWSIVTPGGASEIQGPVRRVRVRAGPAVRPHPERVGE